MQEGIRLTIILLVIAALLGACAPATPTGVPATAPTTPPASAAPTVAPNAAATAASATQPTPAAKIKRGGILRDVDKRTIDSLDAQIANDRRPPFLYLIYDTLLNYRVTDQAAPKFEIRPSLAESYKAIDPTTFEFKLRKGVKFHDGSDFNAAVAKWNLDRAATNPKSVVKAGAPSVIKDVQMVDDSTLRVTLNAPSAIFPLLMSTGTEMFVGMVSKQSVEKMGDDKFGALPAGTGPMKVKEWLRDDRLTLEKFPGYWEKGEDGQPLPYLDGEVTRFILDQAVGVVELRAGNIDTLPEVEPKDVAGLKQNPDLSVQPIPGRWSALPSFYFNPRSGTQYPFSNDVKLREAAQYATDRKSMADALGFGIASPHYYPYWFPGNLGYDETLPRREFSLDKAKQLMTEAGYPDGIDLEVTVINRPPDVRAVETLQAMWAKIGIRVKVTALDRVVWINLGKAGNYEAISHDNNSRVDPQGEQQARTGSSYNFPGYSNPQVDKLYDQAAGEYDNNKRAEIYKQIQKHIYEDAFHLGGYKWPMMIVMSKHVKNWTNYDACKYVWLD